MYPINIDVDFFFNTNDWHEFTQILIGCLGILTMVHGNEYRDTDIRYDDTQIQKISKN